ncbi:hypothetical protein ABZV60_34645 [Streptomyces sp. NPDC004787]|uniref:hypothetical protein n=1 Tax=Streptomyces sp. NPDC004787 TaxID=3154291 RepID=UPI0033A80E24
MRIESLWLAIIAAPAILVSSAGLAAAVTPDGSSQYEDGECWSADYGIGHGYITCRRTFAITGFASSSVGEIDAINQAKAKSDAAASAFRSSNAADFTKKHSGETPSPGAGGGCSFRLASSSFDSWYFPHSQGGANYYGWDPVKDAAKPYGATQRQNWNVNCSVSW